MSNGNLYIVATPIGNLSDFTFRAKEILQEVDLIAAEDTRHSRYLLTHFGIDTKLQALHEHNEQRITQTLLKILQDGKSIALISDAGTPLISDPGMRLVQTAHKNNIKVIPIPGACALISALSAAGFNADKFIFSGFLPAKQQARRHYLSSLVKETHTQIFYEAPHRILASVNDMCEIFGKDRQAVLAKEITKLYETIANNTLEELYNWLIIDEKHQKGEFVILISGYQKTVTTEIDTETENIFKILLAELPRKQAAHLASKITGINKNILYKINL
jgi:16S rRNA (cytidine1402-2'-O)-methyltransferase